MKKLILAVLMLAPAVASADPGYYLQVEAGPSIDPFPGGGIGLNVGRLWGDKNFNYGVEAGLKGNAGMMWLVATTGIDLSALAVAKYTFDCGFVTQAKFGLAYLSQSADVGVSINGVGPKAELGIGYQFNPRWEMDLTAEATAAKVFGAAGNNDDGSDNLTYSGGLFLGLTHTFA